MTSAFPEEMDMKKLYIGVIIGLVVAIPATAVASTYELPWTKNIYNLSDSDMHKSYVGSVSVFGDKDNKCYVARITGGNTNPDSVATSCVKDD